MLTPKHDVALDGVTILGKTFVAADNDSAFAVFDLSNLGCGVVWEEGGGFPYLHFRPALQIPRSIADGFARYIFELDDERFADCKVDATDGEVSVSAHVRSSRPADLEPVISDMLEWIDTALYRAAVDYVAERIVACPAPFVSDDPTITFPAVTE